MNPNELINYFQSLEDKYSDAQCKKIGELLELNLRIEANIKQLREEKCNSEKHKM